ncbi:MAG: tripartite tricarboxylate transporter substrate binding protein [Betaproteobacteria bacterium]|nr:tripartite tricarboxylate transporter substrate binding protein [Betaproteobacteria bacterium]
MSCEVSRIVRFAACVIFFACCAAQAQYPLRPIKMVAPYPPGGSADILARAIAQKMTESLGQQVLVENRGGAAGNIGTEYVAKSPADGYTLLVGTVATHAINPHVFSNLPFDPVRDFAPITPIAQNAIALVAHPAAAANSVRELVDYAKRNPGKLSFGSSGNGTPMHLAGELLKGMAGIDLLHIPYKGAGPAIADLLGGQIPYAFVSLAPALPHLRSGKLKALGMIEATRTPAAPQIPTIGESVPGYALSSWLGLFAPAGTPAPIVEKLNGAALEALKARDVKERLDAQGFDIVTSTPAAFSRLVQEDFEKWGRIVRSIGGKLD